MIKQLIKNFIFSKATTCKICVIFKLQFLIHSLFTSLTIAESPSTDLSALVSYSGYTIKNIL